MYKYGDKRNDRVGAKIMLIMAQSKVIYERMGFWDDISYYQGEDTLAKLARLQPDISTDNYNRLVEIITEDNKTGN
jgi:hypothetical protein